MCQVLLQVGGAAKTKGSLPARLQRIEEPWSHGHLGTVLWQKLSALQGAYQVLAEGLGGWCICTEP